MKLYPKKLSSVEELKREKRLLQLAKDELEDEELFSVKGLKKEGGVDWKELVMGNLGSVAQFIPVSGLGPKVLKKVAGHLLRRKRKEDWDGGEMGKSNRQGDILKTVAKEVIGGYLKWKAIELTYKGIVRFIKSRKEKE